VLGWASNTPRAQKISAVQDQNWGRYRELKNAHPFASIGVIFCMIARKSNC